MMVYRLFLSINIFFSIFLCAVYDRAIAMDPVVKPISPMSFDNGRQVPAIIRTDKCNDDTHLKLIFSIVCANDMILRPFFFLSIPFRNSDTRWSSMRLLCLSCVFAHITILLLFVFLCVCEYFVSEKFRNIFEKLL